MGGRVTGHSKVAGRLQLEGPMKQPRLLTARGNFSGVEIEVESVKLTTMAPAILMRTRQCSWSSFALWARGLTSPPKARWN